MAPRCPRCGQPQCICVRIPRIETATRFVIIRHARELYKASNSGRIAYEALGNSALFDYGLPEQPFEPTWIPDDAWLLFPEGPPARGPPPSTLIVLDGTWKQARHIARRNPVLWRLPRLVLDTPPERKRLRQPPHPCGMSTLEAVAQAVAVLEGDEEGAARLDALYDILRQQVRPTPRRR